MKKSLPIIMLLLLCAGAQAQEPADALRFSWAVPYGTARHQAIGGAMGSLGGDLTALHTNPAGLAFYRTGDIVFSPGFRSDKSKATYRGRAEKDSDRNIILGTSGVVYGQGYEGQRSTAIAIGVTRTADFNQQLLYRGTNNQTSYSQRFLEEIRNGGVRDANRVAGSFPFGTSLAFNTFWIDTISGGSSGNYQFQSRAPIATGLLQEQTLQTSGGIHEFALGVGSTINDKLMVGGTLGVPLLRYSRNSTFTEADATADATNRFDYASFGEDLSSQGIGVNLKAGLIYKPREFIRLGLSLHTPTLYQLTDRYSYAVTTDTEGYKGEQTQSSQEFSGNESEQFKYMLVTPYKATASASYVLREIQDVKKQRGFLTADVEYVHYKAMAFMIDEEENNDPGTEPYLQSLNRSIDNAYKGAFNFRVGGELKFTTLMVRAGAAYYGSPYKNINNEKGNRLNLSGGLGYRDKGYFIDLAYVHSMGRDVHTPYRLQYASYDNAAVRSTTGNVLITVGHKF